MLLDKYVKARDEKNSVLCVGLDPAVPGQRPENTIPREYFKGKGEGEGVLEFCLKIIEETSDHACAIKANAQYILFAMNVEQMKTLNKAAHDRGVISILDSKLSDIGPSNQSSLYWTKKAGFDAITFSPYAGNIREATEAAHEIELGVFVLTLMSNQESAWIQKETTVGGKPLYFEVAEKVHLSKADGVVVGATGHVSEEEIRSVREKTGDDTIFLCPGVGAQGGDVKKLLGNAGQNILINSSRSIIFDVNPGEKAEEYKSLFNKHRG